MKLEEDLGGIAVYKTTMRTDSGFGINNSGIPQSGYQTNMVMDLGQIALTSEDESNVFSTQVMSNPLDDLASQNVNPTLKLIKPMEFFDKNNKPIDIYPNQDNVYNSLLYRRKFVSNQR